jgi:hypothetical protein
MPKNQTFTCDRNLQCVRMPTKAPESAGMPRHQQAAKAVGMSPNQQYVGGHFDSSGRMHWRSESVNRTHHGNCDMSNTALAREIQRTGNFVTPSQYRG